MTTTTKVLGILMAGSPFLVARGARAQLTPEVWKSCSSEIQQFCSDSSSNQAIFQCIERREKLGKNESGISSGCHDTVEKMEDKSDERREHHGKNQERDDDDDD